MSTKTERSIELVTPAVESMTPEQIKALGIVSLGMLTAIGDIPFAGEMLMGLMSAFKESVQQYCPVLYTQYEAALVIYRDHLAEKIRQIEAADKVREVMARESN